MLAAISYTILFALFIGLCAFADFLDRKPSHDPLDNYVDGFGDVPALPSDLKTSFHGTPNITGGQPNHVQH